MAPISDNSLPAKPLVTAPIAKTSHNPASIPRRKTCSTTPAVSATGDVFGIAESAVNPPLAPACEPDSTVSESSFPGSRKWVCRSTNPGSTIFPFA